jgi:hypothetical protein
MVPDFDRADLWFHSGPTFDLFLWVPTDSPREAVKQAFLVLLGHILTADRDRDLRLR